MKFIHLADLHIGKRVHGFSLIDEQKYIFKQILAAVKAENIDAVLIAGDVYDKPNPSAEAISLFDDFLTELAELKPEIFVISGNHDSAERIAFGSNLLNLCGVHMSPVFDGTIKPVTLHDDYGALNIYMLPYIKPAQVKRIFPEAVIESYNDAVKTVIETLRIDRTHRNILLAHQFVTGAQTAGSEELIIGGLDNISADIFDDFDYVALGHIHSAQSVKKENVRYAGTPLKYSFAEATHEKAITIVELKEKGELNLKFLPLKPQHDLRKLKGNCQTLLAGAFSSDYLYITLTDEEEIPDVVNQLRTVYPNLMRLDYDNTRTRAMYNIECAAAVEEKNELELFDELYQLQNGKAMSDEQKKYVLDLLNELKEGAK